ncbi:MAG: GMC family oxidoreductase [Pyrinomonadaceae bacterium]
MWKAFQMQLYQNRGGPIAHYSVTMYMEQVPNPASRLYLGSERDALGMPRLVVDWQFTPFDYEVFQKLLRSLAEAFANAEIGILDFGTEPFTLDDTVDGAHHVGATRMAATPAEGVVDRDCRVFDTENLFIASSSVFPTGPGATPTFTIMALARRLGVHLLKLRATSNVRAAELASR